MNKEVENRSPTRPGNARDKYTMVRSLSVLYLYYHTANVTWHLIDKIAGVVMRDNSSLAASSFICYTIHYTQRIISV